MKHIRYSLILIIAAIPLIVNGSERLVTAELFILHHCGYGGMAITEFNALAEDNWGQILPIVYHMNDEFRSDWSFVRDSFYMFHDAHVFPYFTVDGIESCEGHYHPPYDSLFDLRTEVQSPMEITLDGDALGELTGEITAKVTNTGGKLLAGKIQFLVLESRVPCEGWNIGLDTMMYIVRDMLPDAVGQEVSIEPGEEKTFSRDFQIDTTWYNYTSTENLSFACFVQSSDSAAVEIFQGGILEWYQLGATESESQQVFDIDVPSLSRESFDINLILPTSQHVDISVFDASGRLRNSVTREFMDAGEHTIHFLANDLSSGTYFIVVKTDAYLVSEKLVILK